MSGMIQMVVTVPPGVGPCQIISVVTPVGPAQVAQQWVNHTYQVPAGMGPGSQFMIQVAVPAQSPPARPAYQPPPLTTTNNSRPPPVTSQPYGGARYSGTRGRSPVKDYGQPIPCSDSCYKCICCPCYCPCCCLCLTNKVACVRTGEVAIVERFGEFKRVAEPGELALAAPCGPCLPVEAIARRISMRVETAEIRATTKTKDNVFVTIHVAVLYKVRSVALARDAAYKLTDVVAQLSDYVEDCLRTTLSKVDLDDVFTMGPTLAAAVLEATAERMVGFGFDIITTLVTAIDPEARVKEAMNSINMQRRLKQAQVFNAEASKAVDVKRAEARAEAAYLDGVGTSRMRKAIIDGISLSIETLNLDGAPDSSGDATTLLLTTQLLDTMTALSSDAALSDRGTTTLHLPTDVASVKKLRDRLDFFKAAGVV